MLYLLSGTYTRFSTVPHSKPARKAGSPARMPAPLHPERCGYTYHYGHQQRNVFPRDPDSGKDPSPDYHLRVPGPAPAYLRETITGAAQSLRPGLTAVALEYGTERHNRKRQLGHRRTDRRGQFACYQ